MPPVLTLVRVDNYYTIKSGGDNYYTIKSGGDNYYK